MKRLGALGLILTLGLGLTPLSWAGRIDPELESATIQSQGYTAQDFTVDDDAPTIKGQVNEENFVPDVTYDQGHELPKGERLTLVMMDNLISGFNEAGDEFDARMKTAVMHGDKILIPRGALVHGHLSRVEEPGKALSKRARIVLGFDYILMPDGRKVMFKSAYTKGDNGLAAFGRAIGNGLGGTIAGAVQGVLLGLQSGGIAGAMLSHGATLAVGGGLGSIAGLGEGLSRSGSEVTLHEGDTIQVALTEPLQLPGMTLAPDIVNEIHLPGLGVNVTHYRLERDPFKIANQIALQLRIDNQTDYRFGSLDMVLMDEYQNVFPISPFGGKDMFAMQMQPHSVTEGEAVFNVKSPELRHYLVFYKPYTREVVSKISLTEVLKKLANNKNGKKDSDS